VEVVGRREEGKEKEMIWKRGKGNSRTRGKGFKRRKELGEKAKGGACKSGVKRHVIQGLSLLQVISFLESILIEVVEQFSKPSSESCR